jgi:anti-sigma factor RsiW
MTDLTYPIEELHAFVDDELDGVASAAFLRKLSGNPALAREVAELTALKASVKAVGKEFPCRAPDLDRIFAEHDRQVHARKPNRFLAWLESWQNARGYAGAVLVAVILVLTFSVGWFAYPGFNRESGLVAQAIERHHAWLQQPTRTAQNGRAELASFQAHAPNIYVPDLAASKLRVATVTAFGADGVHVGYI